MTARSSRGARIRGINLGLQGGGAHGAYTWGVLDRFLEDDRIEIRAISGTSAGAMNAVVLADGLMNGGADGARAALRGFWRKVSDEALASPLRRNPVSVFLNDWSLDNSPVYLFLEMLSQMTSPYQLNPLNFNPLLDLLKETVNFDNVRSCEKPLLFISATNVETGVLEVFDRDCLTADMVMASACLPYLFQAMEIDGVPYWDGGYAGNPALFPFFDARVSRDVVIVQINPVRRSGVPKTAREIMNRVNEITFNNSLLKEFRAIDFVARLIETGRLEREHYDKYFIHVVSADKALEPLSASSKMNAEWDFLEHLFDVGRRAAGRWLERNFEHLGARSSVDIRAMFEGNGRNHAKAGHKGK